MARLRLKLKPIDPVIQKKLNQAGWVEGSEIERYDINKVKTYTNG